MTDVQAQLETILDGRTLADVLEHAPRPAALSFEI